MRGKGFDADCVGVRPGITPAYAGKRPTEHSVKRYKRDHPRLCGEKQKIFPSSLGDRGSPPPMRGKGGYISPPLSRVGITPAYAGKSITKLTESAMCQDHPRLCGEK